MQVTVYPVPEISEALITYLEKVFPDKAGSLKESLDELRHRQGQVSVVQHLRAEYNHQNP